MNRIEVQQGEVKPSETGNSPTQPMRWAAMEDTGGAIYIGMLEPHRNGNASGCVCPACGERLQAINVDKDASHFQKSNTRGKFFRHPSGHHRKECHFLASKLAALKLLMDCDEIDLPAPSRRGVVNGISGTTYTEVCTGQRLSGIVKDKVWLDNQTAKITLADGRTVLVLLEARQDYSSLGSADGIITIRVDDPEVASWDPARILEAIQLDERLTCWEKHWDDQSLSDHAQRLAQEEAAQALDLLPSELAMYEGLSNLEKSETVLHAKVKEILSKAGSFLVPEVVQWVTQQTYDGSLLEEPVTFPAQRLFISQVRLEAPMPGMVPDVICMASRSGTPDRKFPLLIEVAVTHFVDAAKRSKIIEQNLACIEIDLARLVTHSRRISIEELREAVLDRHHGKEWIHNPLLAPLVSSKQNELQWQDERARQSWQRKQDHEAMLESLGVQQLLELFLPSLEAYWGGNNSLNLETGGTTNHEEIAEQLEKRGYLGAKDRALTSSRALLYSLQEIRQLHLSQKPVPESAALWRFEYVPTLRKYLSVVLIAAKTYPLMLDEIGGARLEKMRDDLRDFIKEEREEYARPTTHDRLIAEIFPEMREALNHPFGTLGELTVRRHKRIQATNEARYEEAAKKFEEERRLRLEKEATKQREEFEFQAELETKLKLRADALSVARPGLLNGWKPRAPTDSIKARVSSITITRMAGNFRRSGLEVLPLLESAWQAREIGTTPQLWFDRLKLINANHAVLILQVLKAAELVD